MKTSWKKLLTTAGAALLCGALLTGCLGGGGGADGAPVDDKGIGPEAPKEAVAQLKFGDKEALLYEYKGVPPLPAFEGINSNLAVTKDAIYGLSQKEDAYYLKRIAVRDGAVTAVEDVALAENRPLASDGTNIYYVSDVMKFEIACFDKKSVSRFTVQDVKAVRPVLGSKNAYMSSDFVSFSGVLFGEISKEGVKDVKSVLPADEFKKLSSRNDEKNETNDVLMCADKDGFYISTLAGHGSKNREDWTMPLHMYGPTGKKIRTFECNEGIPKEAQKIPIRERHAIATRDYIVFYARGVMRVFNKKDGKYVADINLSVDKKALSPMMVTTDGANHIYFIDEYTKNRIYRIDL